MSTGPYVCQLLQILAVVGVSYFQELVVVTELLPFRGKNFLWGGIISFFRRAFPVLWHVLRRCELVIRRLHKHCAHFPCLNCCSVHLSCSDVMLKVTP